MKLKTLQEWLDEYALTHQHPINQIIHQICVPIIMMSLLGMLRCVPVPAFMNFTWTAEGWIQIWLRKGSFTFYFGQCLYTCLDWTIHWS